VCAPFTIDPPSRPAPRVRVQKPRPDATIKVGAVVKIGWKKKLRGELLQQEVWWSADGGGSWVLLAVTSQRGGAFPWRVPADAATENGKLRIVVWQRSPKDGRTAGSYQRGVAERGVLRIRP
jgi:hypothetical protein